MRLLAIVSLLVVMLAGLAVTPTASAAPPQPACNGIWATTQTVGPVTVFASPPCYEVSIDAVSCPLGPKEWTEVRAGSVAVRVASCGDVEPATAASTPCTCPPPPMSCNGITTVGLLAKVVSVTLTSDCRVIVSILPGAIDCGDPFDGQTVITQGRISIVLPCGDVDSCEPPFYCYPAYSNPVPPICGPTSLCTEPELALCDAPHMCNDAGCPYPVGADGGTDLTVGGLHVTHACGPQDLCSGPMRCTNPIDAQAWLPVCIQPQVEQGPVRAGIDQCRQDHETFPSCASAQRIHRYEQVGPLWAQADVCLPHSPPPTLAVPALGLESTARDPGPCGAADPTQACPAPYPILPCRGLDLASVATASPLPGPLVAYTISDNCHVDLYVKVDVMDCLWGEGYNKSFDEGPVTIWTWGCSPPYPYESAAQAAPPCTCPPPRPLCYEVNRLIAWGDQVQLSDSCAVTVNLEASCGLQGTDQHQVVVGRVTVNYQTCQQPPVE